jgi:hypothetical protein
MTGWLAAVQLEPAHFASPSFAFLHIHPPGFPALGSGDYPASIVDPCAFSPLVEMLNVFSTFLTQGETAITSSSYFGAALPGRFGPSFAKHFTVGDRCI